MSAIDDLIAFARGLIPAGVTDSEEARRLESLVEEVKTDIARTKGILRDWREAHRLAYATGVNATKEAERVRRGARCLRERCKRLEARVRGVERRLAVVNAAYWYATRLNEEMVAITPSSLSMARARLAVRYGDRTMVKAGELALKMLDVLAAGGSLDGIAGGTDGKRS